MDLYGEKDQVFSSDEYSDDDDDDALMNNAVRAQEQNIGINDFGSQNKQSNMRINQKQKELSSLIRRNKISVIYKKKSIKWLNSKKQRERYKALLYLNAKNYSEGEVNPPTLECLKNEHPNPNKLDNHKYDAVHIHDISVEEEQTEVISNSNKKEFIEGNEIAEGKCNTQEDKMLETGNMKTSVEKTNDILRKSITSQSPWLLNQIHDKGEKHNEKKFKPESSQFHKSINDIFPKFDRIATEYIDTNNCLKAVNEKMKSLSNEIDTLNETLHGKEIEFNRLSHLKMVKEEIYSRLNKKRDIILLKENLLNKQNQNTLLELKELESYLSNKSDSSEINLSTITIQKLIEKRANMNAEDLKREKINTSRLHSLLVSQNMLHATESLQNISSIINGEKSDMGFTNKISEISNQKDGARPVNNRCRQGEVRDVKSLIADFRQKNPEFLPRVGKRIKSTESNAHQGYNIPLFKKASCLELLIKDHQHEFYPMANSVDEISITPIGRSKKISSGRDNVYLEDNFSKRQIKNDLLTKCSKNIQYPLCQECKIKESRFVCAGCGNQWYCSKNCQISAWDKHSDQCTE